MRVSPYFNADHGKPLQQMQAPRHRIGAWSFPKAQDEPLGLAGVVLQGACEIPMLPQAHQRAPLLPGCWHGQGRQGKLRAGRGTHIVCEEPGQERPTHRETRRREPDRPIYSCSQMGDMLCEAIEAGNTSLALTESILRSYGIATVPMSASAHATSVGP